ncbi:MAG: LPS-assembly protein LptD [Chlamydiia bacterium]|nr:LPS-assembly protein LptD [Chlamydiia bacterium]MCH9615808.1 LPS-assembly protein LptD [Chlamydiia bacterium]MCH9628789.1 LPS-assembly protein LptD [Chlamydiia bacterium]
MRITLTLLLALSPLFAHEFTVNLRDPEYRDGVIYTDQGGVITSEDLRIQAEVIEYTNNGVDNILKAEGNLMVDNGERVFVGEKLTYDFAAKTGVILGGRTQVNIWFLGGEVIELKNDKSFEIQNAFVTASENINREYDLFMPKVTISPTGLLRAEDVKFRVAKTPIFYLPYFKSNLRAKNDSSVRYKITWDKGQGPKLSMRYKVFSWKYSDLFFRADLRTKRGVGGAIESNYHSPDKRTLFQTKSYLAHDTFYNDNDPNKKKTRYRLQGHLSTSSPDTRTKAFLTYDKISDRNMPGDFPSDDFEVNTARETRFLFRTIQDNFIFGTNLRPRINSFEGFTQELPMTLLTFRPFTLGNSNILIENRFEAGFLNYAPANKVKHLIKSEKALRLSYQNRLLRPINIHGITLTPFAGFIGIAYDNNPEDTGIGQAILRYGANLETTFSKQFTALNHKCNPYINFETLTQPTANDTDVFIFSIKDGYTHMNFFRFGVKNTFYQNSLTPLVSLDTYGLYYKGTWQKAMVDVELNKQRVSSHIETCYNIDKNSLDYANLGAGYTLSKDIAFSFEYRHRGKYDWRKDDHLNFILNNARSNRELLDSPLTDARNTTLSRLQIQLSPLWFTQIEAHQGWGRKDQPYYNEAKVDLFHNIAANWQLRLTYMHTVRDDRVAVDISTIR